MSKKLTQREVLELMLADSNITSNAVYKEYCEKAMERLDKKSASSKKPTATQLANEGIKTEIVALMVKDHPYTITEMIKEFPCCADLTNQKVSALMKQLVESGLVVKTTEKGKSYFSIA